MSLSVTEVETMTHHPDTETLFSALAHQYRRYTLSCLHQHHNLTLADLADEVAVHEHGMTIDGIPPDAVTDIYLALYHCHIPKLEDAALVHYDQDVDLVVITDYGKTVYSWVKKALYESPDQCSRRVS